MRGHYSIAKTVEATAEPITLAQAKLQLRLDGDAEDQSVYACITDARAYVETYTNRQLMTCQYRLRLDYFPSVAYSFMRFYDLRLCDPISINHPLVIWMPKSPIQSIDSITYYDPSGTLTTLDPSQYNVDLDSLPPRIVPLVDGVWPDTQIGRPGAITINFTAGYAGGAPTLDGVPALNTIPGEIMRAMKLLLTENFETRSISVDGRFAENPTVKRLLHAQRVWACP